MTKETICIAVNWFANALYILIFVRVILSWIPSAANNPLGKLVYALTDPILSPIRKLIAKSPLGGPGMMIDFSPFIASLAIMILQNVILSVILA